MKSVDPFENLVRYSASIYINLNQIYILKLLPSNLHSYLIMLTYTDQTFQMHHNSDKNCWQWILVLPRMHKMQYINKIRRKLICLQATAYLLSDDTQVCCLHKNISQQNVLYFINIYNLYSTQVQNIFIWRW